MDDDAAFIAKEVERLADQGKDVVLMGHSYGGIPVTESTKGLSREERERDGKKGGIVRLAYVTAVVPAVGQNCGDVLANLSEESQVEITTDVGLFVSFLYSLSSSPTHQLFLDIGWR